ncbi:hypothetical protein LZQ00_16280 [Sphingobacterium sp. SRCM116780]|uniref:hypothetical protein n=1 Tax=Sphingobacterium sp. SRCM116780 TaxID=2907623 RepID=UPI001F371B7F|nr:hypothetical protein [Sphingobacterium sp. SRCM116780]UIR55810.1 hypothetical protein LZQ00_16280 [Sphingobacterium sp. SRCM116780]
MTDLYYQLRQRFCDSLQKNLTHELLVNEVTPSLTVIKCEQLPFIIQLYGRNIPQRVPFEGQKTIHIDEDILYSKYDIIVKRILAIALHQKKAYARQTVVARVDKKTTIDFLAENHLQGAMPGKYRYGLFLDGELISLAVFSGGRKMPELNIEHYRSFELIRFCNKLGYNVVGGISKLIKAFIGDFHPSDIMTYTDKDWSQDSALEKIGFTKKSEIAPLKFWVHDDFRTLIRDENQYLELEKEFPQGYLKENLGSLKMILTIK